MVKVVKYSGVATSQTNPNVDQEHNWANVNKVVGHNNKTYTSSVYSKYNAPTHYTTKTTYDKNGKSKTVKVADKWEDSYNHPWTLAFHDFGYDIPKLAKIKKITFTAKIRTHSNNLKVLCPIGCFRINTPALHKRLDTAKGKGYSTGWNDGMYMGVPKKTYLTNKWNTYSWTMGEEDIEKADIVPNRVNQNIMGLDLVWQDAEDIKGEYDKTNRIKYQVDVAWVQCTVWYDVQDYELSIRNPVDTIESNGKIKYAQGRGTLNSPFVVDIDEQFHLNIKCHNKSEVSGDNKYITFREPKWADVTVNQYTEGTSYEYNQTMGTSVWTIPHKSNGYYNMNLTIDPQGGGLNKIVAYMYDGISASAEPMSSTAYYFLTSNTYGSGGDSEITITATDNGDENSPDGAFHENALCCLNIDINGQTYSDTVTVTTRPDFTYTLPLNATTYYSLNSELTTTGISILSQTENTIVLDIPDDVNEYRASIKMCFIPTENGRKGIRAKTSDEDVWYANNFLFLEPYEYHLSIGEFGEGDIININNHRVYTEVETESYVISLMADEIDSNMVMGDCQVHMNIFEELDYIGCVPLEHLHFDPKSTYKDTLLNSTYKNKRYMGKKLATDEDITLNVRLHPKQVPTIQGLIDMDKPIPINANHRCFESDPLNHRGWAEIYSIKSELTNPNWYKCDIDVKYLTHNLKTRFNINRGARVNDYKLPSSVYTKTVESGSNLSELVEGNETIVDDVTVVEENQRTFIVDTDGTFMYFADYYDDDIDEYITYDDEERNLFSIDNGESIYIKSVEKLPASCEIIFNWDSSLLDENKENNISRLHKIVDSQGNSLFEYEYSDVTVGDDEVTRDIIARRQDTTGDLIDYQDDVEFRYTPADEDSDASYGTKLHFKIVNNNLSVIDEGFNGMEFTLDDIELKDTDYYYVLEWKNNNDDGESNSVYSYFDFEVYETVLSTTYSDKFSKLVVSPFPVADKKLLFTREAEEGVLYYYQASDNVDEEFSYIIEPYYQYLNGTDLKGDGVSIFNLNYGHEIVYIQNGLVRMGFNRVDNQGHMYLGKYDPTLEDYITTHTFRLGKYTDLNLNTISDDKIEVQASDSTFTIYRGHPYIKINHNTEDIFIDTIFDSVWAEQVGDDEAEAEPTSWSLLNDSNLLPLTVGGRNTINPSDLTVSEVFDSDRDSINLTWDSYPESLLTDTSLTWTIDGDSINNYSDEIYIGGEECSFGTYTFNVESDGEPYRLDLSTNDEIIHTGQTVRCNGKLTDYSGTGISNTTVYYYAKYELDNIKLESDKSIIEDNDEVVFSAELNAISGQTVSGETVYFYEAYNDGELDVTLDKGVIEDNDTVVLSAILKDSDGSRLGNMPVYFMEEYVPVKPIVSFSKGIIQQDSTSDVNVLLKDDDGSRLGGETVNVFRKYTSPTIDLTANEPVIESGESTNLSAYFEDEDMNPIDNREITFYKWETTISGVSITGTTNVLSYVDGDSCSLTATVLDDLGVGVGGQSVELYMNDVLVTTLTSDSNGRVNYTYESSGAGDLIFKAKCGSIYSSNYNVEDCVKYGIQNSDTWHNIKSPNTGTVTDGEFSGYNKMLDYDLDWSQDWSIEVDFKQSAYRVGLIICDESMTSSYDTERYAILLNHPTTIKASLEYKNSSSTLVYSSATSDTYSFNTYYSVKFVKQGTTISAYWDNVLIDSRTNADNISTANIGVFSWNNITGYIKNLKIKPL